MPKITEFVPANISGIYTAVKKEIGQEVASQQTVQISQTASDCVAGMQKGLIKAQKTFPKLNRCSDASDYFGVCSAADIQSRYQNQMALSWLKMREQKLVNFPPIVLSGKKDKRKIEKTLDKLAERGFGRLTVTDKLFGNGANDGTHTVGIVYHKGKYYVLDSIPETYPKIKDYHKRLINFLELNPKDVIFPNKPQQSLDEYTCNNWTHANLDAVINYLESGNNKDLTPEVFDEILPKDINKVLHKQFTETFSELRGRDLSILVTEHYNKTHKFVGL